jgi:hydroxypyruvate reductase
VPVLALGKAATAMLAGAADVLGAQLGPVLAVTRSDAVRPGEPGLTHARVVFGDHPVPGPASLAAGAEIETFCDAVPAGGDLLVLLSGGASALNGSARPSMRAATSWLT